MLSFILPLVFLITPITPVAEPTPEPIVTPMPIPAAQVLPIEVGRDSGKKFAFDWDGKDVDGADFTVTIQKVVFRYTPTAGQQRWVEIDQPVNSGENQVDVKAALVGIPAGVYDLQVRLEDVSGQASTYSTLLSLRVRVKNPSAPRNVRVVGG